jgi:Ca-activated chloride channel family protein
MFKLFLTGTSSFLQREAGLNDVLANPPAADTELARPSMPRSKQLKHLLSMALLIGSIMLIMPVEAEAGVGRDVKKANKLYQEEKYGEALELYDKALSKKPGDQMIQYNRAAALYRGRKFAKAAEAFLRSLAGIDESLEENAMYNVGNSEYRLGEKTEKQDSPKALTNYKKALEYYKRSMRISPHDTDAKYNYEFTLQKIKELEKQQEQEQQEQQQDQQQQEQQEEQEKKDQEQQKQQEQEKKDHQQQKQQEQEKKDQEEEEQEREQQEQEQFPKQEKPDTMDEFEGQMGEEEAEMLLRSQDEEEARMRAEVGKKKRGERPPVVRDW